MQQVAATVQDAGIEPWLSRAIEERQDCRGDRRGSDLDGLPDALTETVRQPKAAD